MRVFAIGLALVAMAGLSLAAQNAVLNGDFSQGTTGWTQIGFNDPLGTTGLRKADVNGNADVTATLYGDFQTLTPVMYAQWNSSNFKLAQGAYPFTADCSWEKALTTSLGSVNRTEFRLMDATTNVQVVSLRQAAPTATTTLVRATFQGVFTVPSTGSYYLQLYLRHSNLAAMAFINNVDDIALGEFGGTISASGSAQVGATTDYLLYAPSAASKAYYVGSSLGTGPIPIDTRKIDLGLDTLLVTSTSGLVPAIFTAYNGFLDATGAATAKLNLPAAPILAGIRIYTAFVSVDGAAPSGILTISNTVGITIQP